jgi:hypothetical protein
MPTNRIEDAAMTLQFYAQTLCSYGAKVLVALYESTVPFEWRQLSLDEMWLFAQVAVLWLLTGVHKE